MLTRQTVFLLLSCRAAYATPAPTKTYPFVKKDVISSAVSAVANIPSEVQDIFSSIGDTVPTQAAAGILPGFDVPSLDQIRSQSGLDDDAIDQLPVRILNIPGYANWTEDQRWNVLFHGQAYKEPLNGSTLDDAANAFIPDNDIDELTPSEQAQARNLTSAIFSLPVEGLDLSFELSANGSNLETVQFPSKTDSRGEFNQFVPIDARLRMQENIVQRLDAHTNISELGNSSIFLVPNTGITFVADIDDILRVTKIYSPQEGLNNSFVRPFTPWSNMPEIFSQWQSTIPSAHFHYLTTTPEPATRMYEDFIFKNYPLGSFDTRPYNFTTVDQIVSVRNVSLVKIFQTFPQRQFVLIGDTSNSDIMKDYPQLAKDFPGSVRCILLRNTTATDSADEFPYDTSGFDGLNSSTYFFFRTSDDLKGLDIQNGQCANSSVTQNVTFDYQNLPFDEEDGALSSTNKQWTLWFSTLLIFTGLGML